MVPIAPSRIKILSFIISSIFFKKEKLKQYRLFINDSSLYKKEDDNFIKEAVGNLENLKYKSLRSGKIDRKYFKSYIDFINQNNLLIQNDPEKIKEHACDH